MLALLCLFIVSHYASLLDPEIFEYELCLGMLSRRSEKARMNGESVVRGQLSVVLWFCKVNGEIRRQR
jgi:hypothetical protein